METKNHLKKQLDVIIFYFFSTKNAFNFNTGSL